MRLTSRMCIFISSISIVLAYVFVKFAPMFLAIAIFYYVLSWMCHNREIKRLRLEIKKITVDPNIEEESI